MFHSGVAAQQGSVSEGDHVLSINGTALHGHAHWEALRILRRAKTREMGVVVLRRAGVSGVWGAGPDIQGQTQTEFPETGEKWYFTRALTKPDRQTFNLELKL